MPPDHFAEVSDPKEIIAQPAQWNEQDNKLPPFQIRVVTRWTANGLASGWVGGESEVGTYVTGYIMLSHCLRKIKEQNTECARVLLFSREMQVTRVSAFHMDVVGKTCSCLVRDLCPDGLPSHLGCILVLFRNVLEQTLAMTRVSAVVNRLCGSFSFSCRYSSDTL